MTVRQWLLGSMSVFGRRYTSGTGPSGTGPSPFGGKAKMGGGSTKEGNSLIV